MTHSASGGRTRPSVSPTPSPSLTTPGQPQLSREFPSPATDPPFPPAAATSADEKDILPCSPSPSSSSLPADAPATEKDGRDPASSSVSPLDEPYPEGGLRAWLVVFGAWCGLVAAFGMTNTSGAFQAYMVEGPLRDYSEGQIGWIFSICLFLSFFCGVAFGPYFDTHGSRWLILSGSVCLVAGVFILSFCQTYWQFMLCFGLLIGFGISLIFTPCFCTPGHYFLARRGVATGIAATGGSVGGVIFPLVLERLGPHVGFPWAVRVIGFISMALLALCNLLVRSRLPPLPDSSSRPSLQIFRGAPAFVCITVAFFFMEIGIFVPISYLTSYAIRERTNAGLAYQLLAVLNGGSFFGRWLAGFVSDRIGRFNTLIVCLATCMVSAFAFWLPGTGSAPLIVVFAVVFGMASGSNISLTSVCVGQLCRTEEYGRYYATCYMLVSFGCLIGIPIAGEVLGAGDGDYLGLILYAGGTFAVALALAVCSRVLASDWKLTTVF